MLIGYCVYTKNLPSSLYSADLYECDFRLLLEDIDRLAAALHVVLLAGKLF